MKRVLVDTDVILDLLEKREPFAQDAARLFQAARTGKLELHISALCVSNLYYLLRKRRGHEQALVQLGLLFKMCDIVSVDKQVVLDAMKSRFTDFEDGIQYFAARATNRIEAIVTRNTKDYRHSEIPVMSPRELLNALEMSED